MTASRLPDGRLWIVVPVNAESAVGTVFGAEMELIDDTDPRHAAMESFATPIDPIELQMLLHQRGEISDEVYVREMQALGAPIIPESVTHKPLR